MSPPSKVLFSLLYFCILTKTAQWDYVQASKRWKINRNTEKLENIGGRFFHRNLSSPQRSLQDARRGKGAKLHEAFPVLLMYIPRLYERIRKRQFVPLKREHQETAERVALILYVRNLL
ncbi:hypothetical protein BD770DRAFT_415376 [Pilaira anomala]|nr:hypothetical protein BD770DRAFT_415376 [Pilaira anomala]